MAGLFSDFNDQEDKSQYCRTCGQKSDEMVPIFEEEGFDRELAEKMNQCLPISVSERDWLPLQVCLRCVLWVETAHQLRNSCLTADKKLRGIFLEPPDSMLIDSDLEEDYGSSHFDNADYGSDNEQPAESSTSNKSPAQASEAKKEEISGGLRFLAAELGVQNPNSLLIVNKEPSQFDSLYLQMPAAKGVERPPFYCHICRENMNSRHTVRRHYWRNHKLDIFPCKICYVFFSKFDMLKDHIKTFHPKFQFRKLIGPTPEPQENWKKRKFVKVYEENKTTKTCRRCGEIFLADDVEAWKKHGMKHRRDEKLEKLKKSNIKCDYCENFFLSEVSKQCHMEFNHKEYKRYECEICQKKFRVKQFYKDHKLSHTSGPSFLCNVCGKAVYSKSVLKQHLSRHADKFVCQICDRSIVKFRKLKHLKLHLDKRMYQCMECGESFFDREALKKHSATHFVTVFQCEICGFCFSSQHNLSIHQGYHKDAATQQYKCPVKSCKQQFATINETSNHFHSHTREQKFTMVRVSAEKDRQRNLFCYYCDMAFRHMGMYLDHMAAHQGGTEASDELACAICKFEVEDEASLTSHLETHPQAFDFPCRHCKENFVTDKQRETHEDIKHGGKVQCPICKLTFRNTAHLNEHTNAAHTGLRPYVCKICGNGFFSSKNLAKHKSVHTNEKRFACEICDRAFRLKPDLNKHVLRHNNEKMYNCSSCSYSTNKRREFDLHIAFKHAQMCDENSD